MDPSSLPSTVLFVHGMGRSSLNWWPTARRFERRGIATETFGYSVFFRTFDDIRKRLAERLARIAAKGDYVVVGHSLGGVLLRAAMADLAPGTSLPRCLFLLGSPISASRLAKGLKASVVFPLLTRDCGRLLGSDERMGQIPKPPVKTIAIIGVRGWNGTLSPFRDEKNDGIVAVSEVGADWFDETIYVPILHSFMPMSRRISDLVLDRIGAPKD